MEPALRQSAWHRVFKSLRRPYKAILSIERGPLGYINSQEVNTRAELFMKTYIICFWPIKGNQVRQVQIYVATIRSTQIYIKKILV